MVDSCNHVHPAEGIVISRTTKSVSEMRQSRHMSIFTPVKSVHHRALCFSFKVYSEQNCSDWPLSAEITDPMKNFDISSFKSRALKLKPPLLPSGCCYCLSHGLGEQRKQRSEKDCPNQMRCAMAPRWCPVAFCVDKGSDDAEGDTLIDAAWFKLGSWH